MTPSPIVVHEFLDFLGQLLGVDPRGINSDMGLPVKWLPAPPGGPCPCPTGPVPPAGAGSALPPDPPESLFGVTLSQTERVAWMQAFHPARSRGPPTS